MPKRPFQLLTIVRLITREPIPPDSDDDARIQAEHIAYLGNLVDKGIILANGPVKRKDDPKIRGMSLYLVGPDEARELANNDPAVKAGWFDVIVDQWMIPVRPKTIADKTDIEIEMFQ